jgi:hypothetical protein
MLGESRPNAPEIHHIQTGGRIMFGIILVSMAGIALPILGGICLTPRVESQAFASEARGSRDLAPLFPRGLASLGALSAGFARRHWNGGAAASSSVRYG